MGAPIESAILLRAPSSCVLPASDRCYLARSGLVFPVKTSSKRERERAAKKREREEGSPKAAKEGRAGASWIKIVDRFERRLLRGRSLGISHRCRDLCSIRVLVGEPETQYEHRQPLGGGSLVLLLGGAE
ncbi:hypothetical protein HPP92_004146 [Vanilla planifolia]|uniref:Uncharacterized protein n=1 Tax=Vanilla planifolia TaxID=51239 RepID=A0A835S346_VANPL|nr:hypothetical protein HPP92_004146 [Vanilla planifolia]